MQGIDADEIYIDEFPEREPDPYLEPEAPVPYSAKALILPVVPTFKSCPRHLSRSPALENLYRLDGTARIWYRLIQDDEQDEWLHLEQLRSLDVFEGIGERPAWFSEEICNSGIDFFSSFGHKGWEGWALENGIAPYQPFAIEHDRPRITGYGEDSDVSFDWELAAIAPLGFRIALLRWEAYFRRKAKIRNEDAAHLAHVHRVRTELVRYMYLNWDRYGECTPYERGVIVTLRSSYDPYHPYRPGNGHELARGVSKKGNRDEAWENLRANIRERAPRVTAQDLEKLKRLSKKGWRSRRQW